MNEIIRQFKKIHLQEVLTLTQEAFKNAAEPKLVENLISGKTVLINLLTIKLDTIVGHVLVSKITMEPDKGLIAGAIAPLSVLPKYQNSGIGTRLMKRLIKESKKAQIDALFLLGNPKYYRRFGFNISKFESNYNSKYFQELELREGCLVNFKSKVIYPNAFSKL